MTSPCRTFHSGYRLTTAMSTPAIFATFSPPPAAGAAIVAYAAVVDAGFDGCLLPAWLESALPDAFAAASLIAARTPRGRIGLTDLAVAHLGADPILHQAAQFAALFGDRLSLGLSLGRPQDLALANVNLAEARRHFDADITALRAGFAGSLPQNRVYADPRYRKTPNWPADLPVPDLFMADALTAEARAITGLPRLGTDHLLVTVNLVAADLDAPSAPAVPHGYHDAAAHDAYLRAPVVQDVINAAPALAAEMIAERLRDRATARIVINLSPLGMAPADQAANRAAAPDLLTALQALL